MIFRVFIIIVIIEYQDWTYQRYALELRSTFFNGKNDKLQKTQCKSVRIFEIGKYGIDYSIYNIYKHEK